MAPKPKPAEKKARWRWFDKADRETREANPEYYWFHGYDAQPRFFWDEIEISKEEYQASTDQARASGIVRQ
jgi:hypothetical protein